jgi:ATP-dependent DNA helicase DinG
MRRGMMTSKIEAFFANDGPLANVLPGYKRRGEQVRLAKEIGKIVSAGGVLLGDAPTGVGKSMGYLVPVALAGKKTVVSTATKALQHQLAAKDLPTLVQACQAAGIPAPSFSLLKGRQEFLCDRRFTEYYEEQGMFVPQELDVIDQWRDVSPTGDKETLPIAPPAYWQEIAADADDCVRHKCPFAEKCFYYRQKDAAAGADILIVNHALLLANLATDGAVFPMKDRVLIADEAHRLEEYISEAYGARVTHRRISYVTTPVKRKAADLDEYLTDVKTAAKNFFEELRTHRALGSEQVAPPSYRELLEGLLAVLRLVESNPQEEVNKLAGMVLKLTSDLRSFYLPLAGTHAYAVLDPARGKGYPVLQSWLVEPAEVFPVEVLDRDGDAKKPAATILTSATLAAGHSFDYQKKRLGISSARARAVEFFGREMFDYAANALVYIAGDLPAPTFGNTDAFVEAAIGRCGELVRMSRGRTMILLSTWKAVQRFKEEFPARTPYPVRFQGEGPTSALIAWLKETEGAVLVGTRSLWEGVDVAGEAVSLVVVDKVPFPPPGDPVIEKLTEKAGSKWFSEVSLPKAVLATRQGVGRLIRRDDDRGVMAILDSRVATKGWGAMIRASLPEGAPITYEMADVEKFFGESPVGDAA